jgi:hypothetical protein
MLKLADGRSGIRSVVSSLDWRGMMERQGHALVLAAQPAEEQMCRQFSGHIISVEGEERGD